ncbi:MAG: hypothetical protein ACC645_26335 [Pirellulales bacterium]
MAHQRIAGAVRRGRSMATWITRVFVPSLLIAAGGALHAQDAPASRIRPSAAYPFYWQYRGEPVLLLAGSCDDNLFQIPNLEEHLDAIRRVGGNYIRNTMSDRPNKGFEVYPFRKLDNGKYDLRQWNDEYWRRFERLLKLTHARDIIVQIEVWDRFDYSDRGSYRYWALHPYNPKNNANYTAAESGLKRTYRKHPGANEQRFFFTVPELENNRVVLPYQQAQVDKMLSYALQYPNVLYCMDNETSGSPKWGAYWSRTIRDRAAKAGVEVQTTEMWDDWNLDAPRHRATFDHPELYAFVDISQNNHQKGQAHWENAQRQRARIVDRPRPLNNVKIYGADGGRFGNTRDGLERFWRNVIGGAASSRFHRPPAGQGLGKRAEAHIRSMRMLTADLDIFRATADAGSRLLGQREPNEAYLTRIDGQQYAVYFPDGGSVELDLTDVTGTFRQRWLNIEQSQWGDPAKVEAGAKVPLAPPGRGHWAVLIDTPRPEGPTRKDP